MKVNEFCTRVMDLNRVSREERRTWNRTTLDDFRDPEAIPDISAAADLVVELIRSKASIALYGDYDADGVTATAVLYRFLRRHGIAPEWSLASRRRGYGLRADAVSQASLVIVSDCGTSDETEVRALIERGSKVIVIDHHTVPRDPSAHPATCLVNPKRSDSTYPHDGLCSAALAWVLCWRVAVRLGEPVPVDIAPLAAIGQVADSGAMRHEGRIITRFGFESARRGFGVLPGLKSILHVQKRDIIDADCAGWAIGPLLNAPGRMGDPDPALRILITDSPIESKRLIGELVEINAARRLATDAAITEAVENAVVMRYAVFSAGTWSGGVAGIVASRLAEDYGLPAFVASVADDGSGAGSCRTAGGLSVYAALQHCSSTLVRWGGHRAASGFRFAPGKLDEFVQLLSTWVPEPRFDEVHDDPREPIPIGVSDLTVPLMRAVERLGPFGIGFERPRVAIEARAEKVRFMGAEKQHARVDIGEVRILKWSGAQEVKDAGIKRGVSIAASGPVAIGSWNGSSYVQITADRIANSDNT